MIHFVFYYRKMDILKKLFISRLSPVRRWDSEFMALLSNDDI